MKISIVTATIRLEGLKKVIESIDNQTFKNWEHIIVNDNNEEVREYLRNTKLSPNRYWIDLGVKTHYYGGFARNIGANMSFSYLRDKERSEDEWICFLDDDNLWYQNHLETLSEGHTERPNATLIGVDTEIRGYKDKELSKVRECQIVHQHCDLGNFLYKKELFDKYGYFRPRVEKKIRFDFELIEKIAKGEGREKIYIINKPTFIFYYKKK